MIPIFNVVLISDKDENVINNGKHVILFPLSKYSDKLYGNIVYKRQIKINNKKPDQIISKLLTLSNYFTSLNLFCLVEHF